MTKKNLLLLIILSSSFNLLAQMTGGGTGKSSSSAPVKSKGAKWGALIIGLSNPIGKFKENNLKVPFDQAVGAKPGFYIGYDANNYFTESEMPFKMGLTTTVGLAVNQVNWEKWVSGTTSFEGTPFVIGDIKIGAIGTYKINEDMKADGFLRLGANYGIGGSGNWSTSSSFSSTEFTADTPAVGFGTNFGGNFRYKRLLTTLQVTTGKLSLDYYGAGTASAKTYKVPITSFRLAIGVIFGKN